MALTRFSLLFAAMVPPSSAYACGGVVQTIVGFDAKGERALVREDRTEGHEGHEEDEPRYLEVYGDHVLLSLSLLDLATGQTVQEWPILRVRDRGDLKVRGQRWKAAEREIIALGVKVEPELQPLSRYLGDGPWTLPSGLKVNASGWCDMETITRTYRVFAEGDLREEPGVALMRGGCSANDVSAGPMYLSPGGQWLVVLGSVYATPTNHVVPLTAIQQR